MNLIGEHEKCECHNLLSGTNVCMPEKCHIIHEDTLDEWEGLQKGIKLAWTAHDEISAHYEESKKIIIEQGEKINSLRRQLNKQ